MAKFRIVKGGTNESKTCDCVAEVKGYSSGAVTCQCTESKYFAGNVPQKWICPDCVKGKHKVF